MRYYKLTQVRNDQKEEIYFKTLGRLEIFYHNDLTHAESSKLEEISKDEAEIVLAHERALENYKRIEKEAQKKFPYLSIRNI